MSPIWWITPVLSDEPALQRLERHCRFTSSETAIRSRPGAHEFAPGNFPAARLELTLENFSLDCFYWVDCLSLHPYMFVSQNLRDAMALGPSDVQYLPVDSSLSAPLPRSKNYMAMHIPTVESVSNPDRSAYSNKGEADGSEKPLAPGLIAIRRDADPKHDIFRDGFFSKFVFCSDRLAVRVLERQCSGVRFIDPEHMYDPLHFRSLRGIEEESRNTAHDAHVVPEDGGIIEVDRVAGNEPNTGDGGIFADYGDRIPGVQFAAVPIPLGPGVRKAIPANWAGSVRLEDGSVRLYSGETITAARLLNAIDRGSDRDAVRSAIAKFELNPEWAADILGARAYVWSNNFAPRNFADVPGTGPVLEEVSICITLLELASPGILYRALQGDRLSIDYMRGTAEEGLSDEAIVES